MKPTVIIVDDVKAVREKLRRALEPKFEILDCVGSGAGAVEVCLQLKPQFVLMDLVMPEMSGIEAMKSILAGARPAPKVIILSGLKEDSLVLQALEAGASDYLMKDCTPNDVVRVLEGLVEDVETAAA